MPVREANDAVDAERLARRLRCRACGARAQANFKGRDWFVECPNCREDGELVRPGPGMGFAVEDRVDRLLADAERTRMTQQAESEGVTNPTRAIEVVTPMQTLTVEQLQQRLQTMEWVVNTWMKVDVDYGIPKGRDGRPINWQTKRLLLPGAEKLRMAFNIPVRTEIVHLDDNPATGDVFARVRTFIQGPDGFVHYEVVRSCSSREPRWSAWYDDEGNPNSRTAELRDLVPERAAKRGYVDAVRHLTGADSYFQGGASVTMDEDGEEAPQETMIRFDMCPLHHTRWARNDRGNFHKIDKPKEGEPNFCNPSFAYSHIINDALQQAGVITGSESDTERRRLRNVASGELTGKPYGDLLVEDVEKLLGLLSDKRSANEQAEAAAAKAPTQAASESPSPEGAGQGESGSTTEASAPTTPEPSAGAGDKRDLFGGE